jgi:tetratricopeptide (TPR) repeat protein
MDSAGRGETLRQAELLFKRDIVLLTKIDVDFPDLVSDYFELARIYETESRFAESEALLLRALAIRKKWQDVQSDDPFNAMILGELYIVYNGRGETARASEAHAQLLESLTQLRTKKTRGSCFHSLSCLFHSYVLSHRRLPPDQAKRFLETALQFSNEAIANQKHPTDISDELRIAAHIKFELHETKQAEQLFNQSMEIAFNNPDCLRTVGLWDLEGMADVLSEQHRYRELEQLQSRYLQAIANEFGALSQDYLNALLESADIWRAHKFPDQEQKLRKQYVALAQRLKER